VNHRLDPAVLGRVLEDSAPRIAVLEGTVAGLPIPPMVQSRVEVNATAAGAVDYERLVAESSDVPSTNR